MPKKPGMLTLAPCSPTSFARPFVLAIIASTARLLRHVVQVARLPGHRDDQGNVDDAARLLRLHRRHHRIAAVLHAAHTDLKDAVPDARVDLLEAGEFDFAEVGGVVDAPPMRPKRETTCAAIWRAEVSPLTSARAYSA